MPYSLVRPLSMHASSAQRYEDVVDEAPDSWVFYRVLALRADIPNDNGDCFPADELKKSYKTFVGQHFRVNHEQARDHAIRGKIFDAYYVKGKDPETGKDGEWVELLVGLDAGK